MKVGDKVRKVNGDYHPRGVVVAKFATTRGKTRFVVEHAWGFLHIYSEANLKVIVKKPKQEIVYGRNRN